MPILANSRHERFAQEVAQGRSAAKAYTEAGFKPHRQNAARLMTYDDVRIRIEELQGMATRETVVTLQWLLDRAEEARAGAMKAGQHAAAIAAIKEMGVLTGVRVERQEQGAPGEFDGMSAAELRERIAERLGLLGFDGEAPVRRKGRKQTH